MKIDDFVKAYLPAAIRAEQVTGIDAIVSLAQAALESGWGEKAPGNEFFGLKDSDGINGNEQLLSTTEYSRYPHLTPSQVGLVTIDHVAPSQSNPGLFVYYGKAYFRKYDTPEEAFIDHAKLFFKHNAKGERPYEAALAFVKTDSLPGQPEKFVDIIAPIYASGPSYASLVKSIMHSITTEIRILGL